MNRTTGNKIINMYGINKRNFFTYEQRPNIFFQYHLNNNFFQNPENIKKNCSFFQNFFGSLKRFFIKKEKILLPQNNIVKPLKNKLNFETPDYNFKILNYFKNKKDIINISKKECIFLDESQFNKIKKIPGCIKINLKKISIQQCLKKINNFDKSTNICVGILFCQKNKPLVFIRNPICYNEGIIDLKSKELKFILCNVD